MDQVAQRVFAVGAKQRDCSCSASRREHMIEGAADLGQGIGGGCGPDEGLWIVVVAVDVVAASHDQLLRIPETFGTGCASRSDRGRNVRSCSTECRCAYIRGSRSGAGRTIFWRRTLHFPFLAPSARIQNATWRAATSWHCKKGGRIRVANLPFKSRSR